jgi:hypothetical protein
LTQGELLIETWEERALRLARELKTLNVEREAVTPKLKSGSNRMPKRWSDLTNMIRAKKYELQRHIEEVP